jgi:hypothetical protein
MEILLERKVEVFNVGLVERVRAQVAVTACGRSRISGRVKIVENIAPSILLSNQVWPDNIFPVSPKLVLATATKNRERIAGGYRIDSAGLPAAKNRIEVVAKAPAHSAADGKLVSETSDQAVGLVKGCGPVIGGDIVRILNEIVLSGANRVDERRLLVRRFGPCVRQVERQAVGEALRQGGLKRIVMRPQNIGIGV